MKEQFKPERVDLVDAQGIIKAEGVLRTEIDQFPDLHLQIVIAVITDNLGRLLVHKRALSKEVNPGDVDHVCGGVMSGETPEQAVIRESEEETGLTPQNIGIIIQGLNSYNRYRYLCVGTAEGVPMGDPKDVEWVGFRSLEELKNNQASGETTFVDEFFEDTSIAFKYLKLK